MTMTIVIIRKFATRVRNHLQRIISSTERDKYKEEVYEVVMNKVSNKRYPEKSTRPIGIIHHPCRTTRPVCVYLSLSLSRDQKLFFFFFSSFISFLRPLRWPAGLDGPLVVPAVCA